MLRENREKEQVTIKNRMISPFQLCFLQFAQAIVLFQGLEPSTGQGLSNDPKYVKIANAVWNRSSERTKNCK
jgi:hypothetical protein